MKKLMISGLILAMGIFFTACDNSGGDVVNDATSLGSTLTLTGTIDRTFTSATQNWAASGVSYTDNFVLNDESDDTVYATQDNTGGATTVNISYSGTTHESHIYSSSGWTGVSSSDANVQITTAQIEVAGTSDEIAYCEFDSVTPELSWYYYLYATGEVIMDGTYVDTDETPNENHVFNNIRFSEGWNQIIKKTSDGVTYNYAAGSLSDGHWCYMDN